MAETANGEQARSASRSPEHQRQVGVHACSHRITQIG